MFVLNKEFMMNIIIAIRCQLIALLMVIHLYQKCFFLKLMKLLIKCNSKIKGICNYIYIPNSRSINKNKYPFL